MKHGWGRIDQDNGSYFEGISSAIQDISKKITKTELVNITMQLKIKNTCKLMIMGSLSTKARSLRVFRFNLNKRSFLKKCLRKYHAKQDLLFPNNQESLSLKNSQEQPIIKWVGRLLLLNGPVNVSLFFHQLDILIKERVKMKTNLKR